MNIHEELEERDREELIGAAKASTVSVDLTSVLHWIIKKFIKK